MCSLATSIRKVLLSQQRKFNISVYDEKMKNFSKGVSAMMAHVVTLASGHCGSTVDLAEFETNRSKTTRLQSPPFHMWSCQCLSVGCYKKVSATGKRTVVGLLTFFCCDQTLSSCFRWSYLYNSNEDTKQCRAKALAHILASKCHAVVPTCLDIKSMPTSCQPAILTVVSCL